MSILLLVKRKSKNYTALLNVIYNLGWESACEIIMKIKQIIWKLDKIEFDLLQLWTHIGFSVNARERLQYNYGI